MKSQLRFISAVVLLALIALNTYGGNQTSQLWTTMNSGGAGGLGVIYTVNPNGSGGSVAISFNGTNGANPSGNMVWGPGGLLYGTCTGGGVDNKGVLFQFQPSDTIFTISHNFDEIAGWQPCNLLLGNDGLIYGTTFIGGANTSATGPFGLGVLYSYDPHSGNFVKLFDFDSASGGVPQGLMQATDGTIYGMCREGGVVNHGALFSYHPGSSGINVLYSFPDATGSLPTNCQLMQAGNGNLYGLTTWGGSNNKGVFFCYNPVLSSYIVLQNFDGANGSYPQCTLLQASNQVLYGLTTYGGASDSGVLFNYNLGNSTYTILHQFQRATGAFPFGSLIQGSDNLLYGVTTQGGDNNTGVIFSYDINQNIYSVVRNCDGADAGGNPLSTILELQTPTSIVNVPASASDIYPNPATEQLNIKIDGQAPEFISVMDINGKRMLQTKFANQLDVSTLCPGVYFVELTYGSTLSRTRFVKL